MEQIETKNLSIINFLNQNNYSKELNINHHKIAVAPMIDITDIHFRTFMRFLTKHSILYTEMINEQAVHHNVKGYKEFLKFYPVQHPIVIQLGGNNPKNIAEAAKLCEEVGYDEVNLNVGCPSDRVQSGKFGACLMKEPHLVAEIMLEMKKSCKIPCTVKCRLGVDEFDSYEFAHDFVKIVSEEGQVEHFIVHARKAYLKGLNPAQNRNIPPLKYDYVLRLKKDFPHLKFSINGGFKTSESIKDILKDENQLNGCMLGRLAYENPWKFSDFDRQFFGYQNPGFTRKEILIEWGKYGKYVQENTENFNYCILNKPIINLFAGEKSASLYRQFLSERSHFKKYPDYQEYITQCIEEYEKVNPSALNEKPVSDESIIKNEYKKQLILNQETSQEDNIIDNNNPYKKQKVQDV